jgi:hypothetical protein
MKGDKANTVMAHEVAEVQKVLQVVLQFVVVLTIPLMTTEPMQEGVGKRCVNTLSKVIFVESMSRIWVLSEQGPKIEQFAGVGFARYWRRQFWKWPVVKGPVWGAGFFFLW